MQLRLFAALYSCDVALIVRLKLRVFLREFSCLCLYFLYWSYSRFSFSQYMAEIQFCRCRQNTTSAIDRLIDHGFQTMFLSMYPVCLSLTVLKGFVSFDWPRIAEN